MDQDRGFDGEEADASEAPDEAMAPRSQMSRKAFVTRATDRVEGRKPDVRKGVEAALATLAEALSEGRNLNLPPLGRLRVTREKDNGRARVLTLRLTLPKSPQPLADASEDD